MNKVKILADSVSDMTLEEASKLGVEIVPLTINFRGKSYLDGIDINADELFKLMEGNDDFPTTSQVPPQRFIDVFTKYIEDGFDIVLITMSSKLSGTYQSAVLASRNFDDGRVKVVDSENVTGGEYTLLKYAIKLRDENLTSSEIETKLNDAKKRLKSTVELDTLANLIRSGRIGKVAGFVGGMLGIKPIISVRDGLLKPISKQRGTKKAINFVLDELKKEDIDKDTTICLGYCSKRENLQALIEECQKNDIKYDILSVGGVTAAHIGPNAVGYFAIVK